MKRVKSLHDDSWATPRICFPYSISFTQNNSNTAPEGGVVNRNASQKKVFVFLLKQGNTEMWILLPADYRMIEVGDTIWMCLTQHKHIPHHTYKTNLSVPTELSKTHTIINSLQKLGIVCIPTPERWQHWWGYPVGKFYLANQSACSKNTSRMAKLSWAVELKDKCGALVVKLCLSHRCKQDKPWECQCEELNRSHSRCVQYGDLQASAKYASYCLAACFLPRWWLTVSAHSVPLTSFPFPPPNMEDYTSEF